MQFKVMMDEDFGKAWKNYYKLCNLSARDFFTNVIVEAGLNSPFEDGCMEKLVDKFEKRRLIDSRFGQADVCKS